MSFHSAHKPTKFRNAPKITQLGCFLSVSSWEQERFRRRKKWHGERRKESFNKDESEKDSDSPESLPDSSETPEVIIARENLVTLMTEQKKKQKQKVMCVGSH